VLAYYRMTPNSSSLEAGQLLRDGLRVLRQGHAPDPRVANPRPEYAAGLPGSTVESQEFYLIAWCAGLAIGAGHDASALVQEAGEDRYTTLDPASIARCVFESATLPLAKSWNGWQDMWPEVHGRAEKFFEALELQSQTTGLGARSLLELKKLVLRHSPTWAPVIEELDGIRARVWEEASRRQAEATEIAGLRAKLDRAEAAAAEQDRLFAVLRGEMDELRRLAVSADGRAATLAGELDDSRCRSDAVAAENASLQSHLSDARARLASYEIYIANLEAQPWFRLGRRLGVAKRPEVALGEQPEAPPAGSRWQLRVEGGNAAHLLFPAGTGDSVRLEISRVRSRTRWDIQLNLPGFRVTAGRRYAVRFQARADKPRAIGVGFAMAHAPWSTLGFYREMRLRREWQTFEREFAAAADELEGRIHFDAGGCRTAVELAAAVLIDEEGRQLGTSDCPAPESEGQTVHAGMGEPLGFQAS
jgi:hypothetical protein